MLWNDISYVALLDTAGRVCGMMADPLLCGATRIGHQITQTQCVYLGRHGIHGMPSASQAGRHCSLWSGHPCYPGHPQVQLWSGDRRTYQPPLGVCPPHTHPCPLTLTLAPSHSHLPPHTHTCPLTLTLAPLTLTLAPLTLTLAPSHLPPSHSPLPPSHSPLPPHTHTCPPHTPTCPPHTHTCPLTLTLAPLTHTLGGPSTTHSVILCPPAFSRNTKYLCRYTNTSLSPDSSTSDRPP